MGRFARTVFCTLVVALFLASCSSVPELESRRADLILVGKVTASIDVALFRLNDPDQEFIGHLYTFQTLKPNGDPGPVTAFVGASTVCPVTTPGDQAYVVFLAKKHNWYVLEYANAPYQGDWSKVWSLRACSPVDDKVSVGFLRYFGPPIFP